LELSIKHLQNKYIPLFHIVKDYTGYCHFYLAQNLILFVGNGDGDSKLTRREDHQYDRCTVKNNDAASIPRSFTKRFIDLQLEFVCVRNAPLRAGF